MKKDKFGNIQQRIDKFKNKKSTSDKAAYHSSKAFNIAVEMVAGAIVGLIIGMFFDNLFDSKPIFLIICIILAMVAAFRSIWKKNIN
ncbi:MAG: AtpZ/AtpI family protein [Pseudomonadota bacterium]